MLLDIMTNAIMWYDHVVKTLQLIKHEWFCWLLFAYNCFKKYIK